MSCHDRHDEFKMKKEKTSLRSFLKYWLRPGYKPNRDWMDLDNASNIFPSVLNTTDTKVFRFTATLRDDIDPALLQKALEQTYNHFPLYHAVIRRGFFWYYFENSDLLPIVQKETQYPCMPLYHYDQRQLLFRVLYYHNRIHLEVFHALSDGTGAFWFLQLLVTNYVFLRYPESLVHTHNLGEIFGLPHYERQEQIDDSFNRYFSQRKKRNSKSDPSIDPKGFEDSVTINNFSDSEDSSDSVNFSDFKENIDLGSSSDRDKDSKILNEQHKWKRIYHIRGLRTQDNRMQIFETEMPVKSVIALAKDKGVTLSVFLTALFIESIHRSIKGKRKDRSITISVPINLRQFYPSNTARNFFTTTLIGHQFGKSEENDELEGICQSVAKQYLEATNLENIEKKLRSLIKLEQNIAIRPIFRPVKNLILRIANFFNNLKITAALSNMGMISFPNPVEDYVDQVYVYTAATRPQFVCMTHKDILTINFTSPYQDTEIQMNFIRRLTEFGVPVVIGANEVNPPEDANEIL